MKFDSEEPQHRPFFASLLFTKAGDLDLGWLFVFLMGLAGLIAFLYETFHNGHGSIPGWSFLASAFASVLIAAIPINKARILAQSKMVGEVAKAVAESTPEKYEPHEWTNETDTDAGIM